jgi:hypothetical protein
MLRSTWLAVAIVGGTALGDASADATVATRWTLGILAWTWWGVAAVALMVLGTLALTVFRVVITASLAAAIVATIVEPGAWTGSFLGVSALGVLLVASPDIATRSVQASAYGAEYRFTLRPPVAFVAPMVLAWIIAVGSWMSGPVLLAERHWIAGILLCLLAAVATPILGLSFHRFSRRWIVVVPAGLVVHDPVVMAETVLIRRHDIARVALAPATTTARDLTGVTWGHAIEITMSGVVPMVPRPRSGQDPVMERPEAILVAPSRPGAFLHAARQGRLV